MKGKKILVTGASGFIGFSLAVELTKNNEVHGIAKFLDDSVRRFLEDAGVRIIRKDITKDRIDDVPADYSYVFNEAAMLRNCDNYAEPALLANTRFVGDLIEHCTRADGVILASTGVVYKPSIKAWKENDPLSPAGTYALTKMCEVLGSYVSEKLDVPSCVLRYFNPYGPVVWEEN